MDDKYSEWLRVVTATAGRGKAKTVSSRSLIITGSRRWTRRRRRARQSAPLSLSDADGGNSANRQYFPPSPARFLIYQSVEAFRVFVCSHFLFYHSVSGRCRVSPSTIYMCFLVSVDRRRYFARWSFLFRRLSENPNDITLVSCIFPSAPRTFCAFHFCIRLHAPSACIHSLTLSRTSSLRCCAAVPLASPSARFHLFVHSFILSFPFHAFLTFAFRSAKGLLLIREMLASVPPCAALLSFPAHNKMFGGV